MSHLYIWKQYTIEKKKKKAEQIKRDPLTTVLMTDFAEFGLNVTEVTLIIFLLETLHNLEKMQRH